MNLELLAEQRGVQALGYALLHFIWQGALIAIVFACACVLLRRSSAQMRYAVACGCLLLMLVLPLGTLLYLLSPAHTGATVNNSAQLFDARSARSQPTAKVSLDHAMLRAQSPNVFEDEDQNAPFERWAQARFTYALPWLVFVWMTGALVLALRLCGGWWLMQRLKRVCTTTTTNARVWQARVAQLAHRMNLSRPVTLCECALVEVPAVIGWMRPIILVPASAFLGLSAEQLEAVLAHELAHIHRHDYLVNLLQSLVETVLFYHPAVWWLSQRIRVEREHACDDIAVEATGDVLVYVRALTQLEDLRQRTYSNALAVAADGGSLMQRIQRLITNQPTTSPRSATFAAGLLVVTLALLSIIAGAQAIASVKKDGTRSTRVNAPVAQARRAVAVTFVNMPTQYTYYAPRAERDTRRLIDSLKANHIPAVGFLNEKKLYDENGKLDEQRVNLLRLWLDAGFELGNETYSHRSLYNTPLEDFLQEVERGEEVSDKLMREHGRKVRYFSYPYLNTGPNAQTKEAAEKFLSARGYTVHPVTIDNMDWLFGKAYADARRREDEDAMQRIRAEYVPYMEHMFNFYEQLSRDVVGYEVPQVLMLTDTALNADQFENLVAMLKRRGYAFISLEEALKDKAYSQPDTYTGNLGISWLQRWAITKGGEFRQEPDLPEYMRQFNTYGNGTADKTAKQTTKE